SWPSSPTSWPTPNAPAPSAPTSTPTTSKPSWSASRRCSATAATPTNSTESSGSSEPASRPRIDLHRRAVAHQPGSEAEYAPVPIGTGQLDERVEVAVQVRVRGDFRTGRRHVLEMQTRLDQRRRIHRVPAAGVVRQRVSEQLGRLVEQCREVEPR